MCVVCGRRDQFIHPHSRVRVAWKNLRCGMMILIYACLGRLESRRRQNTFIGSTRPANYTPVEKLDSLASELWLCVARKLFSSWHGPVCFALTCVARTICRPGMVERLNRIPITCNFLFHGRERSITAFDRRGTALCPAFLGCKTLWVNSIAIAGTQGLSIAGIKIELTLHKIKVRRIPPASATGS